MVEFRPHHFLCTLGFEGKGYSESFVENYSRIADELRGPGGDSIRIRVVRGSDSICTPCPNRRGETCATEEKISTLDRAHEAVHGLLPGTEVSWGEAKKILAEKMSLEDHERICAPCSWRALGVCGAALKRLKEEHA